MRQLERIRNDKSIKELTQMNVVTLKETPLVVRDSVINSGGNENDDYGFTLKSCKLLVALPPDR